MHAQADPKHEDRSLSLDPILQSSALTSLKTNIEHHQDVQRHQDTEHHQALQSPKETSHSKEPAHDQTPKHQPRDDNGWSVATQKGSESPGTRSYTADDQYQLQLWAYETSDRDLTLAERLERKRWESKT